MDRQEDLESEICPKCGRGKGDRFRSLSFDPPPAGENIPFPTKNNQNPNVERGFEAIPDPAGEMKRTSPAGFPNLCTCLS